MRRRFEWLAKDSTKKYSKKRSGKM